MLSAIAGAVCTYYPYPALVRVPTVRECKAGAAAKANQHGCVSRASTGIAYGFSALTLYRQRDLALYFDICAKSVTFVLSG